MITELIQFILRLLGMQKNDTQAVKGETVKWKEEQRKFLSEKTALRDRLRSLKEKILLIQKEIIEKEKERDKSTGHVRSIVEHEIATLFTEIKDTVAGEIAVVVRNLNMTTTMAARIAETLEVLKSPTIGNTTIDDLINSLETLYERMDDQDAQIGELKATQRTKSVPSAPNIEADLAALHMENPNLETNSPIGREEKAIPVSRKTLEPLD